MIKSSAHDVSIRNQCSTTRSVQATKNSSTPTKLLPMIFFLQQMCERKGGRGWNVDRYSTAQRRPTLSPERKVTQADEDGRRWSPLQHLLIFAVAETEVSQQRNNTFKTLFRWRQHRLMRTRRRCSWLLLLDGDII